MRKNFSIIYKKSKKNFPKINKEIREKALQNAELYAIIMKRDCDRYAMKREVAAENAGFSVEYVRF